MFAVVLAGMAVLWTSWFAMCPQDPVRVPLPAAVRWTALALVILGWVLALGALAYGESYRGYRRSTWF